MKGIGSHGVVRAIPAHVVSIVHSSKAIHRRAVAHHVVRAVQVTIIPAKGIAQTIGPDVIPCGQTISSVEERISRVRGAIGQDAQNLAPEGVQVQGRPRIETIPVVHQ